MSEKVAITSGALSAGIDPLGAELQWLRDAQGRDLLWDGDPAFWTGRAPILFPVVGRVVDDRLRLGGGSWPMPKHGFARHSRFDLVERDEASARFRLIDGAETRAAYPFAFALDMAFALDGATLTMMASVTNRDDRTMPFRFGFHPALRWPLPDGGPRADHRLRFDEAEPAPIRRVDASGLLTPDPHPTPVVGRDLMLDDALFADDALIFPDLRSRGCVYGAPGRRGLRVDWPDQPDLGVWTKPGAGYLCIEPWQGFADPIGHRGDFATSRGVISLAPSESRRFAMSVALT